MSRNRCGFVPPYLLRHLTEARPEMASAAATLRVDERFRRAREERAAAPAAPDAAWIVHTADNTEELPGRPVRSAGEPETGDAAVDEAATGIDASLDLLSRAFGRNSYDDAGAPVSLTVHYGVAYVNAFWDGTQLVFGDGDGEVFNRFTQDDVIAHELAHAVTEHSADLLYRDQPGALNESVSDVFASCLRQRLLDQEVTEADWLIGADLFLSGVRARGLRDLADPGSAYDDPQLGKDPQVGHMDDYVETSDDNGGVHINSGIPNRAFHLAATRIGGRSWEGAGQVWMAALTGVGLAPSSGFAEFAAATVAVAGEQADVVREAWLEVGVEPARSDDPVTSPTAPGADPQARVRVRRSGGFIGRTVEGEVDLSGADARVEELRLLVDQARPVPVAEEKPIPDGFTFDFDLCGERCRVGERSLSPALRRIAELVLSDRR